jgi:hypothetical protein
MGCQSSPKASRRMARSSWLDTQMAGRNLDVPSRQLRKVIQDSMEHGARVAFAPEGETFVLNTSGGLGENDERSDRCRRTTIATVVDTFANCRTPPTVNY